MPEVAAAARAALGLVVLLAGPCAATALSEPAEAIGLDLTQRAGRVFDGVGGLSGGGATSTFLLAYNEPERSQILDWMFKPGFGASLHVLKVEVGADDQTTDGCEGCHMRGPDEVNCHRGYEWALMKEAVARNPEIRLYGLPWAWPGWLGFGTNSPYANVTATADYTARWIECARDAHGLNVSVIGLWNEEAPGPVGHQGDYILALRARLDAGQLHQVRIIAPDAGGGGMEQIARAMANSSSLSSAVWGLGSHYPGGAGTSDYLRASKLPMWAAEDYSTYSDATGAGCWGRLLVQNLGWELTSTISWYLISSFAEGMDYGSDGLIRADWPTSGHYELTPMTWTTMHWTRFVQPGWIALPCTDHAVPGTGHGRCALKRGGNYAALASPDSADFTIIVHSFSHSTSACIRNDPPAWTVAGPQNVSWALQGAPAATVVHVWRSCSGWAYPADDDGWFQQLPDTQVSSDGVLEVLIQPECYYTFTTVGGVTKPPVPRSVPSSAGFPLPYSDDFEGAQVGAEAPYFGDQMGKFETMPAGGGRQGRVTRQQLGLQAWPICNRGHSQPLSIIGDMIFEDVTVSADILLETAGLGGGLALRVRNSRFFRGVTPGVYAYIGDATPGIPDKVNPNDPGAGEPGGVPATPNVPMGNTTGWKLCTNSFCNGKPIASGKLPVAWRVGEWHRLTLSVVDQNATATMDGHIFYSGTALAPAQEVEPLTPAQPPHPFGGKIPSSGWAALVSTLGHVQYDNFKLEGQAPGGGAVAACSSAAAVGSKVVSTPCDMPGSLHAWDKLPGGQLRLRSTDLCMAEGDLSGVVVAPCATELAGGYQSVSGSALLTHEHATGRIVTSGASCLDVPTKPGNDGQRWPAAVAGSECGAIPAVSQQYQWHPHTGALRPKASMCTTDFPDTVNEYRDCCLAVCNY